MNPHIEFTDISVNYGLKKALDGVCLEVPRNSIFAVVGPANSGKTTLLKCINRTIDFISTATVRGRVAIDGFDVREVSNVYALRRRIGMVFPLPVGLPMSVYDNVAYAPRRMGITKKADLDGIVETCLKQAVLWDEVKDRLDLLGTRLSGGQQQRLTLARSLSLGPEILCLDEFSIAIDPVTTMKIEEVLAGLKTRMTIILVTNLNQQARRLADFTCFLNESKVIEWGTTTAMFDSPRLEITGAYLNGEFG